jgi:hypothetical protein
VKETDAIFGNLQQVHQRAAFSETTLRTSIDAKAPVLIGPFSRGGKSRLGKKGADHDFKPWGKLTPFGIFLPDSKDLSLYFTPSKVTSDFMVDRLDEWFALKVGVTRTNAPDAAPEYRGRLGDDPGLSREAVLQAATINAAYQLHQDQATGSLEVGKFADLIVLDRNPLTVLAIPVALTMWFLWLRRSATGQGRGWVAPAWLLWSQRVDEWQLWSDWLMVCSAGNTWVSAARDCSTSWTAPV